MRTIPAFAVLAFALVFSARASCANPFPEAIRDLPPTVSNQDIASAFLAEPIYRWKSEIRVSVDFGVTIPAEFEACFLDGLQSRLANSPFSDAVRVRVTTDSSAANFVLRFVRGNAEDQCGDSIEEERYVVAKPLGMAACVTMRTHAGEITSAEAFLSLEHSLKQHFHMFESVPGSCFVPDVANAVFFGTGYYSKRRFEYAGRVDSANFVFGRYEIIFMYLLYSDDLLRSSGREHRREAIEKLIGRVRHPRP